MNIPAKPRRLLAMLGACIAIWCSPAAASDELPFHLGVGVHHGAFVEKPIYDVRRTIGALKDLDIRSFRDDLGWSYFLQQKGTSLPPRLHAIRTLLQSTRNDVLPLLVLTMGSPAFNDGQLPTSDEAIDGFSRFAAQAVLTAKPFGAMFEIWNEWNLGTGTRARKPGSPDDYVRLASEAYQAMKAADPQAEILVGSMATDLDPVPLLKREWVWTRRALELGLLDHADGLSVHLYNNCRIAEERRPSEQIGRLQALVDLLDEFRPGQAFPIYVTEIGWPNPARGCGFTQEQQIAYISQFLLAATQFPSLKGVWIYELKDSGSNHDDLEHNFGLLNEDYSAKPYLCGFTQTRDLLKGARFVSVNRADDGRTEIELERGGRKLTAIWMAGSQEGMRYAVASESTARFICGTQTFAAGQAVELQETPLVVEHASQ